MTKKRTPKPAPPPLARIHFSFDMDPMVYKRIRQDMFLKKAMGNLMPPGFNVLDDFVLTFIACVEKGLPSFDFTPAPARIEFKKTKKKGGKS